MVHKRWLFFAEEGRGIAAGEVVRAEAVRNWHIDVTTNQGMCVSDYSKRIKVNGHGH